MATKPPQGHIGKAARGQSASQPLKTEPVPPSKWARLKDFRRDEKVVFHIVEPCRIDRRAARGMMSAIEEWLIGMQIVSNLAQPRSEIVVAGVEKIGIVSANGAVSGNPDKETRIAAEAVPMGHPVEHFLAWDHRERAAKEELNGERPARSVRGDFGGRAQNHLGICFHQFEHA